MTRDASRILDPSLFEQMVNRLNNISGEPRASVLITHLHIEYILNRTIRKKMPKPDKMIEMNFSSKVTLLESLDILPDELIKNIKILNKIRNYFAHNIDIESKEFNQKFSGLLRQITWYREYRDADELPNHGVFALFSIRLYHTLVGEYNRL